MKTGISIVLAVLNEKQNIQAFLDKLDSVINHYSLKEINEIIFIDDGSDDGTVDTIKSNIKNRQNYIIRLVSRNSKRGLLDAHITGCKFASNQKIIIMDCDLQHPIECLPALVEKSREEMQLVVYSRHVSGGGNIWPPVRGIISRFATFLSHFFVPSTRKIRDPLSGFFMVERALVTDLEPFYNSTKLLLYLLSSPRIDKFVELPYTMVERNKGKSKIVDGTFNFVLDFLIELIKYRKHWTKKAIEVNKHSELDPVDV